MSFRPLSDPNDDLILNAPTWRREPHLYSTISLTPNQIGQMKTFLVRVETTNPLRVTDGDMSIGARFNVSKVPAQIRAQVIAGRSLQIIAKVNRSSLSIFHVTLMSDCSDESLKLRRRVALLAHHVR